MSSVIRSLAVTKEALTRFVKADSPSYINGPEEEEVNVLFPFSYSNQILDITYEGNYFKQRMVDISGNDPDDDNDRESRTTIRILSGPYLATSLGPNFKAYIRSWRAASIDVGSPIEVYIAPQLLRVQEADYKNINSIENETYRISELAPASDNYISGSSVTNYNTTYIFKTPLTFTIVEDGVKKYITFRTVLDQE